MSNIPSATFSFFCGFHVVGFPAARGADQFECKKLGWDMASTFPVKCVNASDMNSVLFLLCGEAKTPLWLNWSIIEVLTGPIHLDRQWEVTTSKYFAG